MLARERKSCVEVCKTESRVYYNINIANNTNQPTLATFNEVRDSAVIKVPEDYYMSIIRFEVPTSLVPIFYPSIKPFPNVANPNLTTMSITLVFGGTDFTFDLLYVPQNALPAPPPPTGPDNPNWPVTPYYYIYSYQQMLDMVNTAFATAFSALKALFPLAPPTQAPYITYDSSTELLSLFAQQLYDPVVAGGPTIEIWMNSELFSYFESWEAFNAGFGVSKDYQILIKNNNNNIPTAPVGYYQFVQEWSSLYQWNSLRNIVFLTGNIPVASEYIPVVNNTGSHVGSNYLQIVTDFLVTPAGPSQFRGYVVYYPQGEYRRTNLKGKEDLKTLDVQIYWQDPLGNLFPMYIPPLDSASIKIMFEHKGSSKYL